MLPKPTVRSLPSYHPGMSVEEVKRQFKLDRVIKIASNENPFGCSPNVLEDFSQYCKKISLYPDGTLKELRETIASNFKLDEQQLIFGNGSEEIIQLISRCFLEPGNNIVLADTTFPLYKINGQIEGAELIEVPLNHGVHNLKLMASSINRMTKIVWVCNPNNPTGTIVSSSDLVTLMNKIPSSVLVVVDEAYYEYVTDNNYPDTLSLLDKYPNLIILRTFSKIYGLASLRIGYGIASSEIVTELNRVRGPFNVNGLAQQVALTAIKDQPFIRDCYQKNIQGIKQLTTSFDHMGLKYLPTQGNYIFVDIGASAADTFKNLLKEGIIVRTDPSWGCPTSIRVTVGSEEENETFLNKLKQFLDKNVQSH